MPLNPGIKYYKIIWLRHDLPASLTVFFVALPLCLGIALASGAPLYSGLLSGIIGGLVVSVISGSSLSVSGPAAGLTTLVAASIISLGDFKVFLLSVIVAGLFQVLLGLLKLGSIANYFPSAVIKGMMAAIGIILISKQIPVAIGFELPDFWTSDFASLFSSGNFSGVKENFPPEISYGSILIAGISILVLISLNQPFAKKLRIIPQPLVLVVAGILINYFFNQENADFELHPSQMVTIGENIFADISFPDFSKFLSQPAIFTNGLTIGLIASLETLLCVEAVDKLDAENRITPKNRELIAQGIGNMTCGLLGAIPLTAVVVRGAANVESGAKTKLSSFTHGLFLLLAVVLVPFLLNTIPLATLAIILLEKGYILTKPQLFINIWKSGQKQFLPFAVTIVAILLTNLLTGVLVGFLVAIYFIIQHNFRADFKITTTRNQGIDTFLIKLNTHVTFLNKANLRKTLDQIPEYSVLTVDASESSFIDFDILEMINEFRNKAHIRHIKLHLKGLD